MSRKNKTIETGLEIAVIGMAGRFPGAKNLEQFWENLRNGVESINFFSDDELIKAGVDPEFLNQSNYVKAKGLLENAEDFDASFFNYSPREALLMDPQTRIFHECVWEALEDAGYNPETYNASIGLYAGAAPNLYGRIASSMVSMESGSEQFAAGQLINPEYLCTRISYKLNLKGPSVYVQTACSTSLTSIHLATRALLTGECKIALAGGVTLTSPQTDGYLYQEGMILSPDGHCRPFDENAKGTVPGEGAGVVVLKPLKNALADGDHIYAVIKATSVNNDGERKVGYTAPSIEGQAEVIRAAHQIGRIAPESISYIEAHGTGTAMGDPMELEALNIAFQLEGKGKVKVGSVKSNLGHLDAAAGVASFIKTVLALTHKAIPPTLNYEQPNPKINIKDSPFTINTDLTKWNSKDGPLRAGVSSFGIGGTNVHIVLEEAPSVSSSISEKKQHIINLTAKTKSALEMKTCELMEYLKKNPTSSLADIAYTLQNGRKEFNYRRALVGSSIGEVIQELEITTHKDQNLLENIRGNRVQTQLCRGEKQSITFMFSGQGAQYIHMGRELYDTEPYFRQQLDSCFEELNQLLGLNLLYVLYPTEDEEERATQALERTEIAQPLIFAFEYSLAKLLIYWGIKPTNMIGYSFGEYVAACIADVFTLNDALRLIAARGALMQKTEPGAMLSVPLTEKQLKPFLNNSELSLAVNNGNSCIVAGTKQSISDFEKLMKQNKYICFPVNTSLAGHSHLMDDIILEFSEIIKNVEMKDPLIPIISGVTGQLIKSNEISNPNYWVNHLRETVQFAKGIQELAKNPLAVFIEIGVGRDLCVLTSRFINNDQFSVNLVPDVSKDIASDYFFLSQISKLWVTGIKIDWNKLYFGENRLRISLPTYPFDQRSFKLDFLNQSKLNEVINQLINENVNKRGKISYPKSMYYTSIWKPSSLLPISNMEKTLDTRFLLFMDKYGVGERLVKILRNKGIETISVYIGERFSQLDDNIFTMNPNKRDHYSQLMSFFRIDNPSHIIHLWNIDTVTDNSGEDFEADTILQKGFYSLLYLAQEIGLQESMKKIQIFVVTSDAYSIGGEGCIEPVKSTVLGPVMVIPKEYPNIHCRNIDISIGNSDVRRINLICEQLLRELNGTKEEYLVAYRGRTRFTQKIESLNGTKATNLSRSLRSKGVYFITGGLGGIGLHIAKHLAETKKVRLVLLNRSPFIPREQWVEWLENHEVSNSISLKIKAIQEIEAIGSEVIIVQGDVSQIDQLKKAVNEVRDRWGSIHGVIHAAGVSDGMIMPRRKYSNTAPILKPKINGTLNLYRLLINTELDFMVLFSSLAAIEGPYGQLAYTSANLYLNTFASNPVVQDAWPVISIVWDRWVNTGVSVSMENLHYELTGTHLDGGISYTQGLDAFDYAIESGLPQIIISSNNPEEFGQINGDSFLNVNTTQENREIRPDLYTEYIPPQNELEKKLAEIWSEFFGIKAVGIMDDFIELGGDSLKAIIIISKMEKRIGVSIPLAVLFENPTIHGIAEYISKDKQSSPIPPHLENETDSDNAINLSGDYELVDIKGDVLEGFIEGGEFSDICPLTSMQEMVLTHNLLNNMNADVFACTIHGDLQTKWFEQAWNEVIKRHAILRTTFRWRRLPEPVQMVYRKTHVHVKELDIISMNSWEKTQFLEEYYANELETSFKVTEYPLMRLTLIKLDKEKNRFVWSFQNSLFDGWSTSILFKEVMTLYTNYAYGKTIKLHKSMSFSSYTKWLKNQNQELTAEFWRKHFLDYAPIEKKLATSEEIFNKRINSAITQMTLSEIEKDKIDVFCKKHGITYNTLITGAWALIQCHQEQSDDVILGIISSGRSAKLKNIESAVGLFTNALPIRVKMFDDGECIEWLRKLQSQLLDITQYEYVVPQQIAKWTNVPHDIIQQAIYEKTIVYMNYPVEIDSDMSIGNLDICDTVSTSRLNVPFRVYVQSGVNFSITFNYDQTRFEQQFIDDLLERFRKILFLLCDQNIDRYLLIKEGR